MVNVIAGVVAVVVGGLAVWLSRSFPAAPNASADPSLLPSSVGMVLLGCGVVLLVIGLVHRARRRAAAVAADGAAPNMWGALRTAEADDVAEHASAGGVGAAVTLPLFVVGVLAYAWLALNLGYLTMTVVFVVAASFGLSRGQGKRGLVVTLITAVVFTAGVEFVFADLLAVRLPEQFLP